MKKVSKSQSATVKMAKSATLKSAPKLSAKLRAELTKLNQRKEAAIDLSDMPGTKKSDWKDARRGLLYRPIKQQITLRIDADVIQWLKDQGSGYQSRLNSILRAEMLKLG